MEARDQKPDWLDALNILDASAWRLSQSKQWFDESEVMEKHASHEVNAGHFDVIPVKP